MQTGENEFEVRVGRSAGDVRPSLRQVRGAIRRAAKPKRASRLARAGGNVRGHFVKGGTKRARPVKATQRRVVVKARFVNHVSGRAKTLRTHIAYLAREGVAKETVGQQQAPAPENDKAPGAEAQLTGQIDYLTRENSEAKAIFYNAETAALDAREIARGWHDDKRHFRLIISAEDGAELGDLKGFVRETMTRLERHVGTRLEWIGVDHWDTDNPHTHVLVRGVRANGADLIIPGKVISVALREDAQEIATRILGPRTELSVRRERESQISARDMTRLDRELIHAQGQGRLGPDFRHSDLAGRLQQLETWGLAGRDDRGHWRVADDLEIQLRNIAQTDAARDLIVRHAPELSMAPMFAAEGSADDAGRLVSLAYSQDGADNLIAIIENGRGELRYARFADADSLAILDGAAKGALIKFEAREASVRPADEAVARIARLSHGRYSYDIHMRLEPNADEALVGANIRRLEAMRRAGLTDRAGDGTFAITADHLDRALSYERERVRRSPVKPRMVSSLTLANQVKAHGPTYLDRFLAGIEEAPAGSGNFVRELDASLQQRRLFLIEMGWLKEGSMELAPSAVHAMAAHELGQIAGRLSAELKMPVSSAPATRIEGVYERRVELAQGRAALIVGSHTAHLVPWGPSLERFAGEQVVGMQRGLNISWSLKKARTVSLPPMG